MALHLFRNLPLKLLSLAVAGVLWFSVAGQSTVERNIQVPLEYRNVPPGLEIVGDPPGAVDVRLRGSSGNLARVVQGDVVAALDLTAARPGTRLFNLQATEVRVPFGVSVVQVNPPTVSLEFERSGAKVVPVSPVVEGEPADGYVVAGITSSPSTVEVVGPLGRLENLREATTEPVMVEGATAPVRDRVTIGVEDTEVRLREAQVATVVVEIRPAVLERRIDKVSLEVLNAKDPRRVRVSRETVAVVVRAVRDRLDGLTEDDLRGIVDVTGLAPGRHTVEVQVAVPDGVVVDRVEPARVTVTIR